jgi:biotin operon repressor
MGDRQGNVTPGDDKWISLGEVARRLGVTRAAVYGRIQRRTLQTRPKGNRGLEV